MMYTIEKVVRSIYFQVLVKTIIVVVGYTIICKL